MSRPLAVTVMLVGAVNVSCGLVGSGGPKEARQITFEAGYADLSLRGEAEVIYTTADGRPVSKTVALPWTSEGIAITPGRSYRVSATDPVVKGSAFNCGVHTDSGWNAGTGDTNGTCVYTFPDDVGD